MHLNKPTLKRSISKEVLLVYGTAGLAAILLLPADFVGININIQTYSLSFIVLYSVRVLIWCYRTLKTPA